jgi:hypothetical protein
MTFRKLNRNRRVALSLFSMALEAKSSRRPETTVGPLNLLSLGQHLISSIMFSFLASARVFLFSVENYLKSS